MTARRWTCKSRPANSAAATSTRRLRPTAGAMKNRQGAQDLVPESRQGNHRDPDAADGFRRGDEDQVGRKPAVSRHASRRRGIQYAATYPFNIDCSGILNCPPARAMTPTYCRAISAAPMPSPSSFWSLVHVDRHLQTLSGEFERRLIVRDRAGAVAADVEAGPRDEIVEFRAGSGFHPRARRRSTAYRRSPRCGSPWPALPCAPDVRHGRRAGADGTLRFEVTISWPPPILRSCTSMPSLM